MSGSAAGLPESWISGAPAPAPAADYRAVTHRNGRFVAVASGGVIAISDDGFTWTQRPSGTANSLNAVANGPDLLVAVGDNGVIATSGDGTTWTSAQPTNLLFNLTGVASGNGIWVAVDRMGHVAESSDAVSWNVTSLGANTTVQGIAFGNGFFAILTAAGIWTSTDGAFWLFHPLNGIAHNCIGFAEGRFLLAGQSCNFVGEAYLCAAQLATSLDTTNWTTQQIGQSGYFGNPTTAPEVTSISLANGYYMAVRADFSVALLPSLCVSPFVPRVPGVRAVVGTNGVFVAVGSGGIYSTFTLIFWPRPERLGNQNLGGIAYGNGTFVASGDLNATIGSTDGQNWAASPAPLIGYQDLCYYPSFSVSMNVQFEGGFFFAGKYYSSTGSDWALTTWTGGYQPHPSLRGGLAYGNGRYVRFLESEFPDNGSFSFDGISWTENGIGGNGFSTNGCFGRVAFGDGVFLAAGYSDLIAVSTNGINWDVRRTGAWTPNDDCLGHTVNDVRYGSGVFVLAAADGKILTSADHGASWTVRYTSSNPIRRIAFGDGGVVGVGVRGTILTSPDAMIWQSIDSGTTNKLNGVAFGNGRWIAVGEQTTILRGVAALPVLAAPTNQAVVADGSASFSIVIDATPDATFQWFKNGARIPDATKGTLLISAAQRSDAGEFCVKVTASTGHAWRCATLGVCQGSAPNTSDPLESWQARIPPGPTGLPATNEINAVAYWPGYGFITVGSSGSTFCSTDGASWNRGVPATTSNLSSLVFVQRSGGFGAPAGDRVLRFSGGCSWTLEFPSDQWALNFISIADGNNTAIGLPPLNLGGNLIRIPFGFGSSFWTNVPAAVGLAQSIAYGLGYFVTVGQDGSLDRSVDGLNWEPAGYYPGPLSDIAYGNGVFVVAVADGTLLVSSNTVEWVDRFTAPAGLRRVAFGNGHFVAVGPQGTMAVSSDGLSWALSDSGTLADLNGVAFGAGSFVVVGSGGTILQSAPVVLSGTRLLPARSMPVGGSATFTAATTGAQQPLGYAWFRDGVLLACTTSATFTLSNVAWDDAGSYQVGISCPTGYDLSPAVGVDLTFGHLQIRPLPEPELTLAVPDNDRYDFEVQSADTPFGEWHPLTMVSVTNGMAIFKDTQSHRPAHRFYRAVLAP